MLTRRTLVLGTALAALVTPAFAADPSASAFVAAIYDAYKGKNAKGIRLDNEASIRRYFEPSLAALIVKDRTDAARRHEVPNLDGDPFVDAQDWNIGKFDIAISDGVPGKATATVKFTNSGTAMTVTLDLVMVANDWRISEITWLEEGKPVSLRQTLAQ